MIFKHHITDTYIKELELIKLNNKISILKVRVIDDDCVVSVNHIDLNSEQLKQLSDSCLKLAEQLDHVEQLK